MGKKAPISAEVASSKTPVSVQPARNEMIRFRFGEVDDKHWPLKKISTDHHERLLKRLAYFETLTVADAIANKLLADYDMSQCPNKTAKKILAQREDPTDALCRLTIGPSGSLRLHGIRVANEFHVLWWDPKHEVWPDKNVR